MSNNMDAAIGNLLTRAQAQAANATAEELVYLAKAIEAVAPGESTNFIVQAAEDGVATITGTGNTKSGEVNAAGTTQVAAVNAAGSTKISEINSALSTQLKTVGGQSLVGSGNVVAGGVTQCVINSDYTGRSLGDNQAYYWGAPQYDISITPTSADSMIKIELEIFGEGDSHNKHGKLQYAIANGAWTDFDLCNTGQKGHLKLGDYYDQDTNSTPHGFSNTLAKKFNTTHKISFRLWCFNGGTFRFNQSWSTSYESAPSSIILTEYAGSASSYTKR